MRKYTNEATEFDDEKKKKDNRMNFNEGAAKDKEECMLRFYISVKSISNWKMRLRIMVKTQSRRSNRT